ncbi:reverse transcriptase-like protein [Secundilactobacillus folii]|uniref:Reverse transcriptase-like protein n=1 Tax=Secundilactobacillus folii TaxID=2678357 RepID=A0A7X3C234_9LACO|nr:reverse transcriptase-like protein [Secundilactobacillus folii]MTV81151.1 reverse transcriptase-like protein [Secundilactobacillus folii]
MYTLYTDAATDTDTAQSAAGILIVHAGQQQQLKAVLPNGDNHHAEFYAALAGFDALLKRLDNPQSVSVRYFTDSKIVADSLAKRYAKHYQKLVDELLSKQAQFNLVINQWVPEKQNQGAHNLAQQALRQHREAD